MIKVNIGKSNPLLWKNDEYWKFFVGISIRKILFIKRIFKERNY